MDRELSDPTSRRRQRSIHVLATIDRERRSGHKIALVVRKKHHATGDIAGFPKPAHRDAPNDLLQHIGRHRTHHLRVDVAWSDRVDSNSVPRAFLCQGLGEAVNTGFGRRIIDLAILTCLPIDAAYIHNAPKFCTLHIVKRELAQVVAGAEGGIEDRIPYVAIHLLQRSIARNPRIVHEDFDCSDLSDNFFHRRAAFPDIRRVEFVTLDASFLREGFGSLVIAGISGDNRPPRLLQCHTDLRPYTSSATCYQCYACHLDSSERLSPLRAALLLSKLPRS